MKQGGFVEAVTFMVNSGSDCWESAYYHNCNRMTWDPSKREVYMGTRASALGPVSAEYPRVKLRVEGVIPYA